MTKYTITLYSKDKTSINHFLEFLQNISKMQNFQILKKLLNKKNNKKKISVLKSPHVNKTAQEQFEYIYYSTKISFNSWEIKKYFTFLKKTKNQLFPDISMNIKTKTYFSKKKNLINLNKILLHRPRVSVKNLKAKNPRVLAQAILNENQLTNTLLYLKILDCYGEF